MPRKPRRMSIVGLGRFGADLVPGCLVGVLYGIDQSRYRLDSGVGPTNSQETKLWDDEHSLTV
jgi:hypothetical protein